MAIADLLKGAKTTDKLVSEDGQTEFWPKEALLTLKLSKPFLFELIGYLPLEISKEEELSEYFGDVRNKITRVKTKTNEEIAKVA